MASNTITITKLLVLTLAATHNGVFNMYEALCAKYFNLIISFRPHNKLMKWTLLVYYSAL